MFIYYLLTYSNLTSQSSRIVDNDSELISIYLHSAENQEGVTFNPPFPVLRWEYKKRWLTEVNSYPFMIELLGKREIRPTAFSFLRRWLSGWKNSEVILSHTTNQLHFDKQLLHNFTLDRNIMIHNTTNIPARPGCGLINAEALLGGYK